MKRLLLVLLALLTLSASVHAQQVQPSAPPVGQPGDVIAARAAAEAWLTLVDGGEYGKSWDAASNLVKKATPKDQWTKTFTDHRQPLGKVVARVSKDAQSTTTLPGTPAGRYVVIRYETSFEHKTAMAETVTCGLDDSGQWKVTGYFVR